MNSGRHILVIGAGIIGLQTALTLLQTGFKVTVLAKHFPGDASIEYTSPWAGAHWRSYAAPDDVERQQWDLKTLRYWQQLLAEEERAGEIGESGIQECGCFEYGSSSMSVWFEKEMKQFRECSVQEMEDMPRSIQRGFFRETIVLNAPKYLSFVYSKVTDLGAIFVKAEIDGSGMQAVLEVCESTVQERDPTTMIDAYVNATGLGALRIVPDLAVHPIRGVTVIVEGSAPMVKAAQWGADPNNPSNSMITYILPRPGTNTTVIGGTKQVDEWTAEADPSEVHGILERAKVFAPELLHDGDFKIVKTQVGLRPGRHGGARVELEQVGSRLVFHAYGNSSCGYQNSVGVAEKVKSLIEQALRVE